MARPFTFALGSILAVIGIAGMVTGGHDHELIVFGVNATHNLVHLVSGLAAIGAALAGERWARLFCVAFGLVYGLVAVAGFARVRAVEEMLNLNAADNFLHVAIAASCLIVALAARARLLPSGARGARVSPGA